MMAFWRWRASFIIALAVLVVRRRVGPNSWATSFSSPASSSNTGRMPSRSRERRPASSRWPELLRFWGGVFHSGNQLNI